MDIIKKPLVSCIIIFLNGDEYITEAIESVFAQSSDNWELLLVDDGSTDNSTEIALDYAQKYPEKVRYLKHDQHQNLGMSAARNLGIAHAKGDYLAFLDADDVWLPEKLQQQVDILEAHPEVGLVYGKGLIWHSWTDRAEDSTRDYFMDFGVKPNTVMMPPDLLEALWTHTIQTPFSSNSLIRRSILTSIGSYENSFRGSHEDTVFYTKVCLNVPVFAADQYWSKYRQHSHSSVGNSRFATQQKRHNARYFFDWAENYLTEQDQKDTAIWLVLQKNRLAACQPLHYFFKQGYLELLMRLGRKLLPASMRHYLWLSIGSRLYGHRIEHEE